MKSKQLGAEFFGTFWLVLGGCGSAVLAAAFPNVGIGLLGVSLAFGLTVLTMAFAVGHISGCHRPLPYVDPPDQHPGHQHVRQSGPQHRRGTVCRRLGRPAAVALLGRPDHRRLARGSVLPLAGRKGLDGKIEKVTMKAK